jgi:hypothetical protein
VSRLEEKRKARSEAFHLRKKALLKLRVQAAKNVAGKVKTHTDALAKAGY